MFLLSDSKIALLWLCAKKHIAQYVYPGYDTIITTKPQQKLPFSYFLCKVWLPKVFFHSLRHSSTTYKLKLNHGDLKATQGDTGHAEIDMITSIYTHILDENRKVNAHYCGFENPVEPGMWAGGTLVSRAFWALRSAF